MPDINNSLAKNQNQSRRKFLKGAAGIGLITTTTLSTKAESIAITNQAHKGAKNCIFLVVDGMGRGTLSLANDYAKHLTGKELNWFQVLRNKQVATALQNTVSESSLVTDSAAASSAWGSGERVPNGHINVRADGQHLNPLFAIAKNRGKAIGLVTTARITHATPAGFVASVKDRDDETSVAQQYLKHEVDVLMGGGARNFYENNGSLLKDFKQSGYAYCKTGDEMIQSKESLKLLGLFSDTHMPYAIDRKYSKNYRQVPKLEEMFGVALSNLSKRKSGFCLQVEAGRVDHAGHAQDIASIVEEQLEFDRCIPIAMEFVEKHPDTLLIITTDHGTGGCQLNGFGAGYEGSNQAMHAISKIRSSFEFIAERLNDEGIASKELFKSLLNIRLTDADVSVVQSMLNGDYRIHPFGYRDPSIDREEGFQRDYLAANLGSYFKRYFLETMGIGWTSDAHTSELVDLMAYGPGSDSIPQYIENFELNGLLRKALKV